MPARNEDGSSIPDFDPANYIVPADILEDDDLWMLLNTYADGEATEAEVLRVEKLLSAHPEVSREFAFLQLTSASVREIGEIDPPVAMTDAIFAATTRRMTFARRFNRWWAQTAAVFGPAPLRLAGATLAAGVLAVVLWSKLTAVKPIQGITSHPPVVQHLVSPHETVAMGPTAPPHTAAPTRSVRKAPDAEHSLAEDRKKWDHVFDIPTLVNAGVQDKPMVSHAVIPVKPAKVKQDPHVDGLPKPKIDAPPAITNIARTGTNMEERHMARDAEPDVKNSKPDDLGPDVNTDPGPSDAEVVAKAMPASYEEPPTTVETVSYKPGSISDKTRNAPPAVQSLYMRTQEAIRRQHEMQQYGGYGKDAYKNIQRGEVGLSLVGGRF